MQVRNQNILVLLCAAFFLVSALLPGVFSQAQAELSYSLGGIPSQTVWQDVERSFILDWRDHTGISFSMDVDPMPVGSVGLQSLTSTAEFSYTPASGDKHPFTVTITAHDGVETMKQSFDIVPMVQLPAEQIVFENKPQSDPLLIDLEDKWDVTQSSTTMNHAFRNTLNIKIVQETIAIEDHPDNDIYSQLNDAPNIASLELTAETVIIRDPLHLPQCNVTINARNLRFEGAQSSLSVVPWSYEKVATPRPSLGVAGANGLASGNINLNIESFYSSHSGTRLDLGGGHGQDGGTGKDGADGGGHFSTPPNWGPDDSSFWLPTAEVWRAPENAKIIFVRSMSYNALGTLVDNRGLPASQEHTYPKDGQDAVASGKPGKGGAGGILNTTVNVNNWANTNPGTPGQTPAQYDPPYAGRSIFNGGTAGTPHKWVKVQLTTWSHILWDDWEFRMTDAWVNYSNYEGTQDGLDAPVTEPDSPAASDYGEVVINSVSTNPYGWITTPMMRKLLHDARTVYLSGDLEGASERLANLSDVISECRETSYWELFSEMEQYELGEMHDEMRTLLYQIASHQDYFGNPAGWVPMLSFESLSGIFNHEIDSAIEMLYLSHWLTRETASETHKRYAIVGLKDRLQKDIDKASEEYDLAVATLSTLKSRAIQIRLDTAKRVADLQDLEQQLELEAHGNVPAEPWWKGMLRGTSALLKTIPVESSVLGLPGQIMDMALSDEDDPWSEGVPQLVDGFIDGAFDDSAQTLSVIGKLAKGDVGGGLSDTIKSFGEAMPSFSEGLEGATEAMQNSVPADQVEAEFDRLAAASPRFNRLVHELKTLKKQQQEFARDLAETQLKLAVCAGTINRNLLAMDALREDLAGMNEIEPRALAYLKELEQQSFDRLTKYHYYLSKAYEYRVLKPYDGTLNLNDLLTEIVQSTDIQDPDIEGGAIPQAQFDSLKGIYQTVISNLAGKIIEDYNNNAQALSAPIRFSLTEEELARINAGETATLNLFEDLGIFPYDEENLRINSFKVIEIETVGVDGVYEENAFVDINIEHSGLSNLMMDGEVYQFQHYSDKTKNPITWGVRYFAADDDPQPIEPSDAAASLLKSLLGGDATSEDILLYSRPSAWADLDIYKEVWNNANKDIHLTKLRVELQYDFNDRAGELGIVDIQVTAWPLTPDGSDDSILAKNFEPYLVVDKADFNQRQDAVGHVHRMYPMTNFDPVNITAPIRYGQWKFYKWVELSQGQMFDLPSGPEFNNSLSIMPNQDITVVAVYVPLDVLEGDFDHNCVVNLKDYSAIAESWLQIHPSLNFDDNIGQVDIAELAIIVSDWNITCEQALQQDAPMEKAYRQNRAIMTTHQQRDIEFGY